MKKIINILLRYLKSSGIKEWNQVAVDWNWDNGLKPLTWIIKQPECDKGTALLVYWVSDPDYFLQYRFKKDIPNYELDRYNLQKEIERRFSTNFYTNELFKLDPTNYEGADYTKCINSISKNKAIPDFMYIKTNGKQLKHGILIEGIPDSVWNEAGQPAE